MSAPHDSPLLDFEKPIVELELKLARLRAAAVGSDGVEAEVERLESQIDRLRRETFAGLSRWEVVQLARHPARPSPLDYIERLAPDFIELHGDRLHADDAAIAGGVGTICGRGAMILAHARGRTPEEQERRRFGMPRPEGFRKVERLVRLADQLGLPVVTFVDTPGAYPGPEAEERGQAMSIARCLEMLSVARPPVVSCVVGEGGSGGALALAVGDRLLVQRWSIFAVISPEACSSILFRDGTHARETAEALRLTAADMIEQGLADRLVEEPAGGAHRDRDEAARLVGEAIGAALDELSSTDLNARLDARYRRIRSYGAFTLEGGETTT